MPADDDEAARLTGLLTTIESGWLTGQSDGMHMPPDADEEEDGP